MTLIRSPQLQRGTAPLTLLAFALPEPALAAGSGMPWEAPFNRYLSRSKARSPRSSR